MEMRMKQNIKNVLQSNIIPLRELFDQNIKPCLKVVGLMILVVGIAYPLILVAIGEFALPYQSSGSLITLYGKVIGSKLIAQEFKSPKFFHSRSASDSASTVDPHITTENAFAQVSRVSKVTGIDLNIERNKVSNALVFAPQYVNVLEVNLDLVKQYPEHYQEFLINMEK
jgi:potassium-transporting ATPase KdpC subunit